MDCLTGLTLDRHGYIRVPAACSKTYLVAALKSEVLMAMAEVGAHLQEPGQHVCC